MRHKLISIIIPTYNSEDFLERCLISITSQTYKNLEIIIINDGSTDRTITICNEWLKKDKRIKIISQENKGLSSARNTGIIESTGDFITFLDSDDCVTKDYIEYLYKLINIKNADISICAYKNVSEQDQDITLLNSKKIYQLTAIQAFEMLLYQKEFSSSAWAKLYKSELFLEIKFPEGKLFEDIAIIYKLFDKSKYINYGKSEKYLYYIHDNSITASLFTLKRLDLIKHVDELKEYIINHYPALHEAANSFCFTFYLQTILKIDKKQKKYYKLQKKLFNSAKKWKWEILKNPKVRLKSKIAAILMYFNSIKLIKFFWKFTKKHC